MRLKIIFAIIIIAVLCYIFIPMVVSVDVVTSWNVKIIYFILFFQIFHLQKSKF